MLHYNVQSVQVSKKMERKKAICIISNKRGGHPFPPSMGRTAGFRVFFSSPLGFVQVCAICGDVRSRGFFSLVRQNMLPYKEKVRLG